MYNALLALTSSLPMKLEKALSIIDQDAPG
ncbi:Uncharacterised protein [Chlamydia trachomatis]|nr:Uncharacterised protein [Chlamydia trachomatis]